MTIYEHLEIRRADERYMTLEVTGYERGTITPLCSTATFSGFNSSSRTSAAIVAAELLRGSPLTVRDSEAVISARDSACYE